ncbi:hypothetical protein ATJ97_2131 [Georgenia soli]|uniref:Uncharacterized protein n=1 Tax=Georgenia soli TaxID=638953 RepID=A0A2A9EN10_9MICO|nr:hypothetical protein [Georgenia soli]PFG39620.1 hypothetical protein ATJ97_2131 [Georgenia soli]
MSPTPSFPGHDGGAAAVPDRECTRPGPCRSYRAGHLIHFIHAGFIRRTPWGWRDGVVRASGEDNVAVVDYLDGSGTAEIWQHHDLSVVAPPGSPVRLHERYYALESGDAILNVLLLRGVGPVPEPETPELWAGEGDPIFVDLATGRGVRAPRR